MSAEGELARCQAFWTFVAAVLGLICLVVLASVVTRMILDWRKGPVARGDAKYRKPS